ncbi:MAG TPA: hypothetical protein VG206_23985 [Terriglobia bacterium]|nr:hypothetical protein [Terriglobia bacterium]
MDQRALIIIGVAAIVLIVVIAVAATRRSKQKRSERLRNRFGPEYDRVVAEHGGQTAAEKALEEREKRWAKLIIRPLSAVDREHFAEAWRTVQARFVDAPGEAVTQADQLLEQLMAQRGYPVGDFEQQAIDLSVDHPHVVQNYRAAREVAERQRAGKAGTEDLREALIQYRALYDELLSPNISIASEVRK